jgi:hypothetical protein
VIRVRQKHLVQMAQAIALEHFEDEMALHLRDFAPVHAYALGDDGVRRAIRLGIARARAYEVTNPGLLRLYVELMFLFGASFDTDPLHPWASDILRDPSLPDQTTRVDRLYDAMLGYLAAVEGPGRSFSPQARRNLQQILLDGAFAAGVVDERRALETVARVHLQRAAYLGEAPLRALVHAGAAEATRLGLATAGGVVVTTWLMFALGHGFAEDPLYPWVQATLRDPTLAGPEARVAGLRRALGMHLDRALRLREGARVDGPG